MAKNEGKKDLYSIIIKKVSDKKDNWLLLKEYKSFTKNGHLSLKLKTAKIADEAMWFVVAEEAAAVAQHIEEMCSQEYQVELISNDK